MCSIEKCAPCTTCTIEVCRWNRNPNIVLTRAEKAVLTNIFKEQGCPFKGKKYFSEIETPDVQQ